MQVYTLLQVDYMNLSSSDLFKHNTNFKALCSLQLLVVCLRLFAFSDFNL